MERGTRFVLCAAVCLSAWALPGEVTGQDFSGSFIAQPSKSGTQETLTIVQDKDGIVFTTTNSGKAMKNRCPFSGAGAYASAGGPQGRCTATIKGNTIIVESIVKTPTARIHTRERWQLSPDMKTLTIKSQSDSPDYPEASAILGGTLSFTQKYTRQDSH